MSDGVNEEAEGSDVVGKPATEEAQAPLTEQAEQQPATEPPQDDQQPEEPAAVEAPSPSAPSLPSPDDSPVVQKHFVAPALIPLERVDLDDAFRVRSAEELEDVAALATDLARLGQLFPIDVRVLPPDRFQIITGFRRVAALRFLQREKVLARLHTDLSDGDATLMALADAIHSRSVSQESLAAAKDTLETSGRLTAAVRDMLEKALATEDSLSPEQMEEEVDADELASDVTMRLGQANQDLSLLADVFGELDDRRKDELLRQLRYSVDLVAFLESKR